MHWSDKPETASANLAPSTKFKCSHRLAARTVDSQSSDIGSSPFASTKFGRVAQIVEHLPEEQSVAGAVPAATTKIYRLSKCGHCASLKS